MNLHQFGLLFHFFNLPKKDHNFVELKATCIAAYKGLKYNLN
jgi:hypothetical protein